MRGFLVAMLLATACADSPPKTPAEEEQERRAWESANESLRNLNEAQFGSGRGSRCSDDRDCRRDEVCVAAGRSGECARRR